MKLKQIGMVLALIVAAGCSKQSGQPVAGADSSNQGDVISLRNVYAISLNGAAYLMTEVQNTGKVGVTAFQGTWTITDELGNKVEDQQIKYMSDTPYATPDGIKQPHVITPGEDILVVIQAVSGQPDNVFATTKDNLDKIGNPVFVALLKESKLDDYRVTKKTTFDVEKVVTQ